MIDVDVGDQRTTINLSRASNNLLNPSEANVVRWRQANYANTSHNNNNNNNNGNANDNGFTGYSRVSCLSLDSPRP
jgi:hypothetical protein